MDLAAIRDTLAAANAGGITGHARPPGTVPRFPAYIVHDPTLIRYHTAAGRRAEILLPVRFIVARADEQRSTRELDDLLSTVPYLIEQINPGGAWSSIAADTSTGGYADWSQGGRVVGLAADVTLTIIT